MRGLLTSLLCVTALLTAPAYAGNLTVFAAASTVQVLDEIRDHWDPENKTQLRIVYGSSGALARQIDAGAPADVFFSANSKWVDYLTARKRTRPETRQVLFRNRIVVVAPAGDAAPPAFDPATDIVRMLGADGRLAIGDPQHVPAGIYARQALSALGLWAQITHRAVRTQNVRLALALVQRGEAALGIVYYTDAVRTGQVRILSTFDGALHDPIRYEAVAVGSGGGAESPAAARLLAYLDSEEAVEIYRKYGFLPR